MIPSIRETGSYSIKPKIEAPKAPPQQIPRAPKTYKERETYHYKYQLVERISMALNAYRRQKDRMVDIMYQMKRIVSGE